MIPLQEIQHRISALQSAMAAVDLDAALIIQRTDLYYFSGTGQDAHLFIPVQGSPLLLVRKTFDRAIQESPLEAIQPVKGFTDLKKSIESTFGRPLRSLGLELDVLPVNNYRQYEQLFPDTDLRDVSPLVRDLRMTKSQYEVELVRKAARINDSLFEKVREILKEGMSELEFAGLMEAHYRRMGHQGHVRVRSFNQEVFYGHIMSGANLAVPSCSVGPTGGPGVNPSFPQGASLKIIKKHEPVHLDYVAVYEGYMVDQSRLFFMGEPSEEFSRRHAVAVAIQEELATRGKAGTRAEDLYDVAVAMVEEAGFQEGFMGYPQSVPFVGHGVGLELDELPVVGRRSPHILKEGMVIALEPKFILPDKGLAGLENSFLVTTDGLEKLTTFDDAIHVV